MLLLAAATLPPEPSPLALLSVYALSFAIPPIVTAGLLSLLSPKLLKIKIPFLRALPITLGITAMYILIHIPFSRLPSQNLFLELTVNFVLAALICTTTLPRPDAQPLTLRPRPLLLALTLLILQTFLTLSLFILATHTTTVRIGDLPYT